MWNEFKFGHIIAICYRNWITVIVKCNICNVLFKLNLKLPRRKEITNFPWANFFLSLRNHHKISPKPAPPVSGNSLDSGETPLKCLLEVFNWTLLFSDIWRNYRCHIQDDKGLRGHSNILSLIDKKKSLIFLVLIHKLLVPVAARSKA